MIIKNVNSKDYIQIYNYQMQFVSPHYFSTDYNCWLESFDNDIDGGGRKLFKTLFVKAIYNNEKMVGFIQYGETSFGFDDNGEISNDISYAVIRNFYFDENRIDAAKCLLDAALNYFNKFNVIYAFFHYFGMSCFARHGKLFEKHRPIQKFLNDNGFVIEHENVYYTLKIKDVNEVEIQLEVHELTQGNQQCIDFMYNDKQVGGCEIHLINKDVAYLRWIYINDDIKGIGIGSKCMNALKHYLYQKQIKRFDTDTALKNNVAQHYYEKNGFANTGITRSYILISK